MKVPADRAVSDELGPGTVAGHGQGGTVPAVPAAAFDRAPVWCRPDDARQASLVRCWGDGAVHMFAAMLAFVAEDLVEFGFRPDRQLSGGIAGIAVAGVFDDRQVVVKLSPGVFALERQTAVLAHWGPEVTAEVVASDDWWVMLTDVGTPLTVGERWWPTAADVLDRAVAAGPLEDLPPAGEMLDGLAGMAERRAASAAFHGPVGLADLRARVRDVTGSPVTVVSHGDLHDGNWLVDGTGRLRLIDPEAHGSGPEEDRARWVLGGGTGQVAGRARFARQRWGACPQTGAWVELVARERAGALVHHGKSEAWGRRFVVVADAAAAAIAR